MTPATTAPPTPAPTPEAAGITLAALSGRVEVFDAAAGAWRLSAPTEPLAVGTLIRTRAVSTARIVLPDGSRILLQPATALAVTAFARDTAASIVQARVDLVKGNAFFQIRPLVREESAYVVAMPAAVFVTQGMSAAQAKSGGGVLLKPISQIDTGTVMLDAGDDGADLLSGRGHLAGVRAAEDTGTLTPYILQLTAFGDLISTGRTTVPDIAVERDLDEAAPELLESLLGSGDVPAIPTPDFFQPAPNASAGAQLTAAAITPELLRQILTGLAAALLESGGDKSSLLPSLVLTADGQADYDWYAGLFSRLDKPLLLNAAAAADGGFIGAYGLDGDPDRPLLENFVQSRGLTDDPTGDFILSNSLDDDPLGDFILSNSLDEVSFGFGANAAACSAGATLGANSLVIEQCPDDVAALDVEAIVASRTAGGFSGSTVNVPITFAAALDFPFMGQPINREALITNFLAALEGPPAQPIYDSGGELIGFLPPPAIAFDAAGTPLGLMPAAPETLEGGLLMADDDALLSAKVGWQMRDPNSGELVPAGLGQIATWGLGVMSPRDIVSPRDIFQPELQPIYSPVSLDPTTGQLRPTVMLFDENGQLAGLEILDPAAMFTGRLIAAPLATDGDSFPLVTDGDSFPLVTEPETFPIFGDGKSFPIFGKGTTFPFAAALATDPETFPLATDGDTFPLATDPETFPLATDGDTFPLATDGDTFPLTAFTFAADGQRSEWLIPDPLIHDAAGNVIGYQSPPRLVTGADGLPVGWAMNEATFFDQSMADQERILIVFDAQGSARTLDQFLPAQVTRGDARAAAILTYPPPLSPNPDLWGTIGETTLPEIYPVLDIMALLEMGVTTGMSGELFVALETPGGAANIVRLSSSPIVGEDGQIIGWTALPGVALDAQGQPMAIIASGDDAAGLRAAWDAVWTPEGTTLPPSLPTRISAESLEPEDDSAGLGAAETLPAAEPSLNQGEHNSESGMSAPVFIAADGTQHLIPPSSGGGDDKGGEESGDGKPGESGAIDQATLDKLRQKGVNIDGFLACMQSGGEFASCAEANMSGGGKEGEQPSGDKEGDK